jgi:hypothetical protein
MKQTTSRKYLAQALELEAAGDLVGARIPAIKAHNLARNPQDYEAAKEAFQRIVIIPDDEKEGA